jgi:hypothetical protein
VEQDLFRTTGYDEYVRVFLVNDAERPDFADPAMPAALDVLRSHTGTPDDCFVALWTGYGANVLPPGPRFDISDSRYGGPVRTYVLLEAPLDRLFEHGMFQADQTLYEEPHAIWPADRAWFIAADVDPEWCTVGAAHEAAAELLADPRFDSEFVPYGTRLTDAGR